MSDKLNKAIIIADDFFGINGEKAMGRLSIDYPDNFTAAFNQSKGAFEQEAKMAMAVKTTIHNAFPDRGFKP